LSFGGKNKGFSVYDIWAKQIPCYNEKQSKAFAQAMAVD